MTTWTKSHTAKDMPSLILDNLHQMSTPAVELNARLTRNQVHQQGITFFLSPPTAPIPSLTIFSFISAALTSGLVELQNYNEAITLIIQIGLGRQKYE